MTREGTCSSDERWRYYNEAFLAPMPWFRMDSDFLNDPKVRRLGFIGGWTFVGMYCGLIAHLASEEGHIYDVSDEFGWAVLQEHMSLTGKPVDSETLRTFVDTIAALGLIDAEMYAESGRIASNRLVKEAENYAEKTARNKLHGAAMREAKEAKGKGGS